MRISIPSITLFLCFSSLVSANLPAQTQPSVVKNIPLTSAKPSDKYAGESVVVERSDQLYVMNADGTGYREQAMVVRVQSEAALRQLGILDIPFAGASERVEIQYARVRRPDGTVIETAITDALEQPQPVTREAPFYSDHKQKQLPIKSLRAGDKLEWKVRVVRTKAEAPGHFWGQNTFVNQGIALSETLELRVPKDKPTTVWTNPKLNQKPTETTEAALHVYRWESASLKPTTGPEAEAEKKKKEKEIWTAEQELDAKEGSLPSVAWTTFKSWESVGDWYRSLEADRMVPNAALKAKVAELTAGKTTQEEKVRAIYAFVSTQVRYIGVAFGVGRYQPHHADEVMDNQYGDCKDKHTLLAAMLTVLGLHPDAALIGAGIRFNEDVPSPAAFNHLITRVNVEGKEIWLDTTAEVAPYQMLTLTIRDKQALVIPEAGVAKLERTPALPPFASFQTMKVEGVLTKDGVEQSHVSFRMRGDAELLMRQIEHRIAPSQYEQFSQQVWGGLGFDGTTTHSEISRPEDTKEPASMAFDDKREKAGGDWEHYRIVAQLLPSSLPEVDEKNPPVRAIQLGAPQTMSSSFSMKLPEGWGAELPEAVHEEAAFARYDMKFRLDKGTVYAERTLVILQDKVAVSDWKSYKKWQEKAQANSSPYIQLTRPRSAGEAKSSGNTKPEADPPGSAPSNADAAKLVQSALDAVNKRDFVTAAPLLEQAKKLNAQQRFLWSATAYMALLKGEPSEAITDYRKELALHRDEYWIYEWIARAQTAAGKPNEAVETIRLWAAEDASNPTAVERLIGALQEKGKPDEAVAAAKAGFETLPEEGRKNERLQLAYGTAQLKAGRKTDGAATLSALLRSTDDTGIMNDGAYELSEANVELPLAESTERAMLARMDAETQSWTLDENLQTLQQKSALLVASWDTMGWILFREGKAEEARGWIEPAWSNAAGVLVGEHLGDIQMALNNADAALRSYEQALESTPKHDLLGVKITKESATQTELKAKIEAARKAGGKSGGRTPMEMLKDLRVLPVGPANGRSGFASYRLLMAHGAVERVEAMDETSIAGGAEQVKKLNLPQLFPKSSQAKLVRIARMNCHESVCEVALMP